MAQRNEIVISSKRLKLRPKITTLIKKQKRGKIWNHGRDVNGTIYQENVRITKRGKKVIKA